jgi:hypothetical protein
MVTFIDFFRFVWYNYDMSRIVCFRFIVFIVATISFLSLFSCSLGNEAVVPETAAFTLRMPDSVHRVGINASGAGSLTLNGLNNNDVFLVKVNTTSSTKPITASQSQSVLGETPSIGAEGRIPAGTITLGGETLTRYERRWDITSPLPSPHDTVRANRSVAPSYAEVVGSTKQFYIDTSSTKKEATLKYIGTYCKIWVVNSNFDNNSSTDDDNKITQAQIDALAAKFDLIYPLETNLLGYEYGGGPGGNGGMDDDSKIQILLYDIDGDFNNHSNGIVLGYFYSGDEYTDGTSPDQGTIIKSNEAEIFYLDVEMLDAKPTNMYSTLIHEFNHMINFNVKVLKTGAASNFAIWYTEMLSMLAEDAIGPLVGIPYDPKMSNGNVIWGRINPTWLVYYAVGAMQWYDSNPLLYYASNYAFGAYLVRNFGGPELLTRIAKSNLGGKDSLDQALSTLNRTAEGASVNSTYALSRFGEALVYSGLSIPEHALSFDKTVTGTIGGSTYTFPPFDIWEMGYTITETGGAKEDYVGPIVYSYDAPSPGLVPYSVQLYSKNDEWQNKTGSLTVNLSGENTGVTYYVLVR